MAGFRVAHRAGSTWQELLQSALAELAGRRPGENIGFLYATDYLAPHLGEILAKLRAETGIADWIGTTGIGIGARGEAGAAVEYYDRPALALMVGALPEGSFRVFEPVHGGLGPFRSENAAWLAAAQPLLGIVHGDPRNPLTPGIVSELAEATGSFLVGGLTSSRGRNLQVADGLVEGGLSGVAFADSITVATRLTQGCSPLGPKHEITSAQHNVIIRLDGRPALEVFKEDIGEQLSRDLNRIGGHVFAGLPIKGSDTGDYLVRNLVGIDPANGLIAIGELVQQGGSVMFCKRDAKTANEDMARMLGSIKQGMFSRPRGGVYYSCLGRGASLFGPNSEELKMIREALGEFPLVGFFCNGEISHNRLYGYTGVLTLFV
jgi:small ligand-binding sensory domain FIST